MKTMTPATPATFVVARLHGPFPATQALPAWTARYQAVRSLCARDADFRTRVLCALSLNDRSRLISQAKRTPPPSAAFTCDFCGCGMTIILTPATDDDAGWARLGEEHKLDCALVATRGVVVTQGEHGDEQSA